VIDIVADPNLLHQGVHAHALAQGLAKHGIAHRIISPWESVHSDVCACWGWRIAAPLVAAHKQVLLMERGYIGDRTVWTSFGWNGLNGRAQFAPPAQPHSRFARLFPDALKAWDADGTYALLIGQVEGDSALHGLDFQTWATRTAAKMAKAFKLPVKYRAHPLAIEYGQKDTVPGCETIRGTLADALAGAAVVVTFNSNAGVDALLAGKPTVALDAGSMVYPIAANELVIPDAPSRDQWANDLAWCQFNQDEIRSGFAWECASHVIRTS
jgi:hypothetical protein